MKFRNEAVREEYHKLDTGIQHSIALLEDRLTKCGQFVQIDGVHLGSEVVISIHSKPILSQPVDNFET